MGDTLFDMGTPRGQTTRPVDPLWDVLIELFHAGGLNDMERSKLQHVHKMLRQSHATPREVRKRCAAWSLRHTLTPTTLAKYWSDAKVRVTGQRAPTVAEAVANNERIKREDAEFDAVRDGYRQEVAAGRVYCNSLTSDDFLQRRQRLLQSRPSGISENVWRQDLLNDDGARLKRQIWIDAERPEVKP
jgi:hypothetical protein